MKVNIHTTLHGPDAVSILSVLLNKKVHIECNSGVHGWGKLTGLTHQNGITTVYIDNEPFTSASRIKALAVTA